MKKIICSSHRPPAGRIRRRPGADSCWSPVADRGGVVEEKIVVFRRYPFRIGERLYIEDGPRKGDWEVISVSERKVGLRCPVSGTRVEWDRFCYLVDERPAP